MKITLAVPTNRRVNPKTAQSVMDLVARGGYDFHIVIAEEGYTVAENRNFIATRAVNNLSDYLLMIDDDMTVEPEALDKLIANDKDICGVAYHPRTETGTITKYLDETHAVKLEENDDPKYKTCFKCYATGTGVILIKCSVFVRIPRPWFMFEYHETGQCKLGEDWYFCILAGRYGIETWCDPRIGVTHIGEKLLRSDGVSNDLVVGSETPSQGGTNK